MPCFAVPLHCDKQQTKRNTHKMKRLSLILLACLTAVMAKAQVYGNMQLQYDYGHNYGTLTTEIGHSHKSGNGFGFVDFDFGKVADNGMYFEYGYNFRLKNNFYARAEYDGGVLFDSGITYAHGVLLGGAYQKFVKKTFLQMALMYRMDIDYRLGTAGHGLQGTAVCNTKFLRDKLYFEGYVDLNYKATEERFQFSTELQLLYCFNRHFAAGTEVEIENYFTDVKVSPKMMLKYSF